MFSRLEAARVLGVGPEDADAVIRAAYRKIAISCHPSQNVDQNERFREVILLRTPGCGTELCSDGHLLSFSLTLKPGMDDSLEALPSSGLIGDLTPLPPDHVTERAKFRALASSTTST